MQKIEMPSLVVVDRTKPVEMPVWLMRMMTPEHHESGPKEYHLSGLLIWKGPALHVVDDMYRHLHLRGTLGRCLRMHDIAAVLDLGVEVYLTKFGDVAIPAWASAGCYGHGECGLPYITVVHIGTTKELRIDWLTFGEHLPRNHATYTFP
jgi:hypothetical protein